MRRFGATLGLVCLLGWAGGACAEDLAPGSLMSGIVGSQRLPGSFVAVQSDDGDLVVMSENGRFAVRGQLVDTWTQRVLRTVDDVRGSATTVPLEQMKLNTSDLSPYRFGTGEKRVVVFVDPAPACSACRDMLADLRALGNDYTVEVIAVPASGRGSEIAVGALHCSSEPDVAWASVFDRPLLDQNKPAGCDQAPVQRRLLVARVLGISKVPYIIAPDGRFHAGRIEEGVGSWLRR